MSDISQITPNLYVASEMSPEDLPQIEQQQFALVISMIGQRRPAPKLAAAGRELMWIKSYDHFLTPIPIKRLLRGVNRALPVIQSGKKVLVFCREGKRRSVTMAASILIALNYTSEEAMTLLKAKREASNPMYFYVRWRIRKFERHWRKITGASR